MWPPNATHNNTHGVKICIKLSRLVREEVEHGQYPIKLTHSDVIIGVHVAYHIVLVLNNIQYLICQSLPHQNLQQDLKLSTDPKHGYHNNVRIVPNEFKCLGLSNLHLASAAASESCCCKGWFKIVACSVLCIVINLVLWWPADRRHFALSPHPQKLT